MFISQKSRYALRALYELAKRGDNGHVKIIDVAKAQAIPPRFLEVILGQLKQGGFVESRRGSDGGYRLVRSPTSLTVGDVLRFLQGSFEPVDPTSDAESPSASEAYAFKPLWNELRTSVSGILDSTTFANLLENEERQGNGGVLDYTI
jgi:Rrf2 family protein